MNQIFRPFLRFIDDYHFAWLEQCKISFEELKRRLTNAPVLTIPNIDKPFEVFCDASY